MPDDQSSASETPNPKNPIILWLTLIVPSAVFIFAIEYADLPAAFLIGPMIAGIIVGMRGGGIELPKIGTPIAQTLIGGLIASAVTASAFVTFSLDWPLYVAVAFSVLGASALLGWAMSRWGSMGGTTAVWGTVPGAATAMALMAEAFGADHRLVGFMQYLRVVIVAISASLVAAFVASDGTVAAELLNFFPPIDMVRFPATLAILFAGSQAGRLSRMPGGVLLGSLTAGAIANASGLVELQLPPWLMIPCYIYVGWRTGLGFNASILRHALSLLPRIIGSILALMAFCGALAYLLTQMTGVDMLTAYLATSPGGMDAIAVIAAADRHVDLSFVMTVQLVRFLVVLLFGPPLSRAIARMVKKRAG